VNREEALAHLRPYAEKARGFSGWMHDVRVRPPDPPVPWDYAALVADLARDARSALDLGTGGGERLAVMRPLLPERVYATEEWHVNAPIAHRRLRAVGVPVVQCSSLHLPFRPST
jgi:hypothetical protein